MRTVFLGEDGVCAGEEQTARVQSAVAASLLIARGSLRPTGGGGGDGCGCIGCLPFIAGVLVAYFLVEIIFWGG